MTSSSQANQIYEHLKSGGKVTGLDAVKKFGCLKLPNRISDIERDFKVTVARQWKEVRTRFGVKKVMEYSINQPS